MNPERLQRQLEGATGTHLPGAGRFGTPGRLEACPNASGRVIASRPSPSLAGMPVAAVGHMPFAGHRNQAEVRRAENIRAWVKYFTEA